MREWLDLLRQSWQWAGKHKDNMDTGETPPPQPPEEVRAKKQLFFEVMTHRLDNQLQVNDSLAQRTATWMTVPSLVITFLATLLVAERDSLTSLWWYAISIGFLLYVASLVILYFAYQPIEFREGPFRNEIASNVGDDHFRVEDMHYSIAFFLAKSTLVDNDRLIKQKNRTLRIGVIFALISVMWLLGIVIVNLRPQNATHAYVSPPATLVAFPRATPTPLSTS